MGEWKEYKLGDIVSIASGFAYKGEHIGHGDNLLLGMGCVSFKEKFLISGARPYCGDCAERYLVKSGDIVLATRQQSDNLPILGMPAIIPEELKEKKLIVGANLYRVTNKSDFDNKYIYWLLKTPAYVRHIASCKTGTTVAMITKADIENFVFVAPDDKLERQRILETIDSLDNKIDLLHRENTTLEAMAETLFRQWFIEEANGDWDEGKLGDVCLYATEKIDISNVDVDTYISTENMCPNKQGIVEASSIPVNIKATKYIQDDILLSNIRPYFKKIWLADRNGACSNDVLCIRSKSDDLKYFTYYTTRQDDFFDYVMLGAKGCKMPRGDKQHIMNWPIIIPTNNVLQRFNTIVESGMEKIRNNNKQIQTLIQTRNSILPKLMSNEIVI